MAGINHADRPATSCLWRFCAIMINIQKAAVTIDFCLRVHADHGHPAATYIAKAHQQIDERGLARVGGDNDGPFRLRRTGMSGRGVPPPRPDMRPITTYK